MYFFFKKRKIYVDAFIGNPATHTLFPVRHAVYFLPEWWKKLPSSFIQPDSPSDQIELNTLKKCTGFLELYKKGFIIPLWADVLIETKYDGALRYQYAGAIEEAIDSHDRAQYGPHFNNLIHAKMQSPWLFQEKTGLQFHFSSPVWNMINTFDGIIPPGVVNYKFQHQTNINMFLPKMNNSYHLEAGMPLVHIVPMTEKEVVFKTHCLSDEEMAQVHKKSFQMFKFSGTYRARKKILTNLEKESKCPFSIYK